MRTLADGGQAWREVPRAWLSESELAGYRNRLDRLVPMLRRSPDARAIWGRLAQFTARRVAERGPDWGAVSELRVVNSNWPTRLPEMREPAGRWRLPPFAEIPAARLTDLALVRLEDGRVAEVRTGTAAAQEKPARSSASHVPQAAEPGAGPSQTSPLLRRRMLPQRNGVPAQEKPVKPPSVCQSCQKEGCAHPPDAAGKSPVNAARTATIPDQP